VCALHRRLVWLAPMLATMLVQAMLAVNVFALPVVAPQAAAEIGIDSSWVGLYSATVFGVAIFSSLAAGAAVRRWGAVRTGQLCLVLGALAAQLAASGALPLLVLAAVALGLAFGPETPAASHLLATVTTARNRPLVFSAKQIGSQLGGIGAGLVFPWLLILVFRWQAILIATGVLSLLVAALLEPLHRTYDTDRDPGARLQVASFRHTLSLVASTDGLRGLAIAGFGFSALQQCLNTFLVVHLVRNLEQPLAVAGVALAVAQVAGIVARIGTGVLADRLCSTRVLLVALGLGMTLAALGLAVAEVDWSRAALFAVCALFGLSATGWQGIFLAEVARLAPENRAADATGGILAAAYGGLVFGPLTFGLMVGAGVDYELGYSVMAMLSLLGTCALAVAVTARVSSNAPR